MVRYRLTISLELHTERGEGEAVSLDDFVRDASRDLVAGILEDLGDQRIVGISADCEVQRIHRTIAVEPN